VIVECPASGGSDFLVSYAQPDQGWAEWVAWTLEEEGFRVLVQAWDMPVGSNRVAGVDEGVERAARTVVILSEEYVRSVVGAAEWRAAWSKDPSGRDRILLVARVVPCEPPGLLGQVIPFDLFEMTEEAVRDELLRVARLAVSGERAKPKVRPPFPPDLHRVSSPGRSPEVWNAPPRLVHFVGREDLLDELSRRLSASGAAAVHGLGGVGKTQFAVEYCHRRSRDYDLVWWAPAEEPRLLVESLTELAEKVGTTVAGHAEASARAAVELLRTGGEGASPVGWWCWTTPTSPRTSRWWTRCWAGRRPAAGMSW
jgi:hypothetical protein